MRNVKLLLGPLLFLILYNFPLVTAGDNTGKVIAVVAWMLTWWITEVVSISVTALIPLTVFPLIGVMDIGSVSSNYGHPIIFLFFGGFVMALALEKVKLHNRIALNIIKVTGTNPNRIILGFMISTAFLSMWISNTATAVLMLPVALNVIQLIKKEKLSQQNQKGEKYFALALMLSIAYSANVGGVATLIGTPPNVVMVGFMEKQFNTNISFLKWMMVGVPFTSIMIALLYFFLVKVFYPNRLEGDIDANKLLAKEFRQLGKMKKKEKRVLLIFTCVIVLWISRPFIVKLFPFITLTDTGISLLATFAFFSLPINLKKTTFILKWKDTKKLPWGILLLFGGGLSLANALSNAGFINFIGDIISENKTLSIFIVGCILVIVMLLLTEFIGNVALVAVFAPMIAGIALGLGQSPFLFLIPVTIASSCAFMLPMSTPPNAIVFASKYIRVSDMVKIGLVMNIVSVIIIILLMKFIFPLLF